MIIMYLLAGMIFVYSLILLSGRKIVFDYKLNNIVSVLISLSPIVSILIRDIYTGNFNQSTIIIVSICTVIILLSFYISSKRREHIYWIHNVKEDDIINIIVEYLQKNRIDYQVREYKDEIRLPDFYRSILIRGIMDITLDLKDIKDLEFRDELANEVIVGVKKINKKYFPLEGAFYLGLSVFICWFTVIFTK